MYPASKNDADIDVPIDDAGYDEFQVDPQIWESFISHYYHDENPLNSNGEDDENNYYVDPLHGTMVTFMHTPDRGHDFYK